MKLFNFHAMWAFDKGLAYAGMYGSYRVIQQRIDEEGCGAVFAA